VFGTDKKYWFIPAYSDEDVRRMPVLHGLDYPSKPDLDAQVREFSNNKRVLWGEGSHLNGSEGDRLPKPRTDTI